MIDIAALNSKIIRFQLLKVLHFSEVIKGANEQFLLDYLGGLGLSVTKADIRRQLFYLRERGLLTIIDETKDIWAARLTPEGIDVIEETVKFPEYLSKS